MTELLFVVLCRFYPVDNTLGLKDSVITSLMQAIETHIRNEKYLKDLVPLQWLRVCDQLAQDPRKAMSLDDFTTMTSGCNVQPEDVQQLLKLLSEVGSVMYSTEESLKNIVVTNPVAFMIEAVAKYVCDYLVHVVPEHAKAKLHRSEWQVGQIVLLSFCFPVSHFYILPFSFFECLITIPTNTTPLSLSLSLSLSVS